MKKSPLLSGLVIRTAVVASPGYGFIFAADPKKEKVGTPHAVVLTFDNGELEPGDYNYNAHSACLIEKPDVGIVDVAEQGYYTANTEGSLVTADIFESSIPPPSRRRTGGIRSVHSIAGIAYAVGIRGMVYRMDSADKWTRIDEGLPESFDVEAIGGFAANQLYAVGHKGQIWFYDGKRWYQQESSTNQNLTALKCAAGRTVYVGGHGGVLIRGRRDAWSVIDHGDTTEDVWDIEWFADKVFVSTLDGLFELRGDRLHAVNFGKHTPKTTYQLSATDEVMWSNGEHDIIEFDGKGWTRLV